MYHEAKLPPPFIYDYIVQKIIYNVSPDGVVFARPVEYNGRAIEMIQPPDIEPYLRDPAYFLLGWHECYYEAQQATIKGQLTERAVEKLIYVNHSINLQILEYVKRIGTRVNGQVVPFGLKGKPIRSFEKTLFDLGWKFGWQATYPDDKLGFTGVSEEMQARLYDEPEMQLLSMVFEDVKIEAPVQEKANVPQEAQQAEAGMRAIIDALNSISLRLSRLEGNNAPGYVSGSGQPRPIDDAGSYSPGYLGHGPFPSATHRGVELRPAVSE